MLRRDGAAAGKTPAWAPTPRQAASMLTGGVAAEWKGKITVTPAAVHIAHPGPSRQHAESGFRKRGWRRKRMAEGDPCSRKRRRQRRYRRAGSACERAGVVYASAGFFRRKE